MRFGILTRGNGIGCSGEERPVRASLFMPVVVIVLGSFHFTPSAVAQVPRVNVPQVRVNVPKVTPPKVNVSTPRISVSTPKVNVSTPKVNVSTPKVNVSTP